MSIIQLINDCKQRYLQIDEFGILNDACKTDEAVVITAIQLMLAKNFLNQEQIDYLFVNSKYMCTDLSYLLKKYVSENIVVNYISGVDTLLEDNIFSKKEIHKNLYYVLPNVKIEAMLDAIKRLCAKYPQQFEFNTELFEFVDKNIAAYPARIRELFAQLDFPALEMLMAQALRFTRNRIMDELDWLILGDPKFDTYLSNTLNDNSDLCKYVSQMSSSVLYSLILFRCMMDCRDRIPLTIESILQRALLDKHSDMILRVSRDYPKKALLKRLYEANDDVTIKKFLEQNKMNNEIKDLVVYY